MDESNFIEIYHIIDQLKHYAASLGYTVFINYNEGDSTNLVFVKNDKIQFTAKDLSEVLSIHSVFESMIETENIDCVSSIKTDVLIGDAQKCLDVLNGKISEYDF